MMLDLDPVTYRGGSGTKIKRLRVCFTRLYQSVPLLENRLKRRIPSKGTRNEYRLKRRRMLLMH